MAVFIEKGEAPLSIRQATKRGMAHVAAELSRAGARKGDEELLRVIPHAELPARLVEVIKALGHVSYAAYAMAWEADNLTNGAHNLFNHQLVAFRRAQARLASYRLADGRPKIMADRQVVDDLGNPVLDTVTGAPVVETYTLQPAIAPLSAEIDIAVIDEATGEPTGMQTVPNPQVTRDDAERAAAAAVIAATPPEVVSFASAQSPAGQLD